MGEARPGRKLVISGDTAPCEMTRVAAHEAQLLVHDASFADEEIERAAETGHSTARQAAELAAEAGVELLALVHISSRYDVRAVLAEAREAFPARDRAARLRPGRDPVPRARRAAPASRTAPASRASRARASRPGS